MASSSKKSGGAKGWLLALLAIAIATVGLGSGAVLHPMLNEPFIAGVVVVPMWIGSSVVGGIIDALLGKRR